MRLRAQTWICTLHALGLWVAVIALLQRLALREETSLHVSSCEVAPAVYFSDRVVLPHGIGPAFVHIAADGRIAHVAPGASATSSAASPATQRELSGQGACFTSTSAHSARRATTHHSFRGPFSDASTSMFATKYSFCSIFRDLQNELAEFSKFCRKFQKKSKIQENFAKSREIHREFADFAKFCKFCQHFANSVSSFCRS